MHRLFWKLFLSFWVALLLFAVGVLLAASIYLDRQHENREFGKALTLIEGLTGEAQTIATRDGMEALKAWAHEHDDELLMALLAVNRDGQDLLGREVPQRLQARLHLYMNGRDGSGAGRRAPVLTPAGEAYWLILDYEGASLPRLVSRPRIVAVQILLATLIGGLVCLVLARYITAPIEKLQRAVHAYGEGNFSQRAGAQLGRRRDEIADLAAALDAMAARVETLLQSHRVLLRDVSHELRSPLARVQAALGLARQRQGADIEPELDRIEREADRLNDLIGGILSFSRLESGAHKLQRELVRLDLVVASAVEDACFQVEGADCNLQFRNAVGEASCTIDLPLLHSALENVLGNALRYAGKGQIEVRLERTADRYLISVADSGPGVPAELLLQIFEPFVRVDPSRSGKMGGVGLGLAIALRSVEALGGSIAAHNRAQGGLEVAISLPA